jgi:hypothetical protein
MLRSLNRNQSPSLKSRTNGLSLLWNVISVETIAKSECSGMFWVDVKINPPRDKFIIIRYEIFQGKDGDFFKFIAFEDHQQFFAKTKNEGSVK